jgi:hypothetical protein
MRVGWNHIGAIQNFYRVPQGETIHVGDRMLIEGFVVKDKINQGKPLLILFCIIKPGACLPMKVDYQVED